MKRILFILFIQLSAIFSLMADDGGTTNVEDWTYGNIYVKEPNDKIALEKELMVCSMDSITAIFVFKNTTDDTVAVDCAFPIDVVLPYTIENVKENEYELWRCYSFRVLRMLLGTKDTIDPKEVVGLDGSIAINDRIKESIQQHDKELRVMSWKNYVGYIDSLELENTMSTSFSENSYIPECEIEQNGQFVDIQNVGIESSVSSKEIKMQFHFHHQLKFLPNAYSKVVVKYRVESMKQNYNGEYGYTYDISTGGTWKGNIQSFMVATLNCDMKSVSKNYLNSSFDYLCCNELEHCGIYYKNNYKPVEGDYFKFFQNYTSSYDHEYFPEPKYDELKSIPLKDVRSSLWINANAAMDKSQFTSCSIVDWKNAKLDFTLSQDAIGPFICNGTNGNFDTQNDLNEFKKILNESDRVFESIDGRFMTYDEKKTDFSTDTSIYNCNWIKKIKLNRFETESDTISYNLSKYDMRCFPLLYNWHRINSVVGINYFPAGRYRLTIEDCFMGNKNQDTTKITEFWFLPIPSDMGDMLRQDKESKFPIFQNIIELMNRSKNSFYIGTLMSYSYFSEEIDEDGISDTVSVLEQEEATPKVVILNREIPLSVLIGALIFTVLIILGCVYWQKKHKI